MDTTVLGAQPSHVTARKHVPLHQPTTPLRSCRYLACAPWCALHGHAPEHTLVGCCSVLEGLFEEGILQGLEGFSSKDESARVVG